MRTTFVLSVLIGFQCNLLMKTFMSCLRMRSTFAFIFSFSAASKSATFDTASTRTRDPNT